MVRIAKSKTWLAGAAVALACFVSPAMAITGVWDGQLRGANGETSAVSYHFSATGNPILRFPTRNGLRAVELQGVGQKNEWLLPGHGWARGTVRALSVEPYRVQAVVSIYSESGGGSLLDQRERVLMLEFVQSSAGAVQATVVTDYTGYSSGAGLGLYAGRQSRNAMQGMLYPGR